MATAQYQALQQFALDDIDLMLWQAGQEKRADLLGLVGKPDYEQELLAWLHPGQRRAWDSLRRIVAVLAGFQSGKSVFGPPWLWREIQRCGDGDYIAATATYDLFKLKMLPALLDLFVHKLGIGTYRPSDRIIELSNPKARIILRSAESGGGLESATGKAAWLDEAGQDSFTIDSFEAVMRRLAIHQGRVLMTTTLYNMGWLKQRIHDKWLAGDEEIDVIQFDSIENPAFPVEEYERLRETLPAWKFQMFVRGRYERPAGLIYDCFDTNEHVVPWFAIPADWKRHGGLDFGGVNTAALFIAEEPGHEKGKEQYYVYREYHAGNRTASQHTEALKAGEPTIPSFVGGSKSEGQWRREFAVAGLPIHEPRISEVEVGIGRGYSLFAGKRIKVLDTCIGFINDLQTYSRKLDAMGEPTEDIENKASWHRMDAYRYIATRLADVRRIGQVL